MFAINEIGYVHVNFIGKMHLEISQMVTHLRNDYLFQLKGGDEEFYV